LIPFAGKPTSTSFPSLAICVNAARSCSRLIAVQVKTSIIALPAMQVGLVAFWSALILLLHLWEGKKHGVPVDREREIENIQHCMTMIKLCEERWHLAGRLWDILHELAHIGDVALPEGQTRAGECSKCDESPSLLPEPQASTFGQDMMGHWDTAASQEYNFGPETVTSHNYNGSLLPTFSHEDHVRTGALAAGAHRQSSSPFFSHQLSGTTIAGANQNKGGPASNVFNDPQLASFSEGVPQGHTVGSRQRFPVAGSVTSQPIPQPFVAQFSGAGAGAGDDAATSYNCTAMWTTPFGFELDDWRAYMNNVSNLAYYR